VILKDNEGHFDDRVQSALDVFQSSIAEPSHVSVTTLELDANTAEAVLEIATSSQYDFIMTGHSKLDLSTGKEDKHTAPPLRRFTSGDSCASTPRRGPTMGVITPKRGLPTTSNANTPRRGHKSTKAGSVLGKLGRLISHANVQASILIVHGANSFMESSTSLSMQVRRGRSSSSNSSSSSSSILPSITDLTILPIIAATRCLKRPNNRLTSNMWIGMWKLALLPSN